MSSLLELKNLTKLQWTILVLCWLGWVFDIMDTALFNFAKAPMLTEMLGTARYKLEGARWEGGIQSVFLVGWAVGGLIFGLLADRWGRTRALMLTILLYCGFTGLTALCRSPEQVMAARFLTALGIGGEWAAGAALVAETVPDAARAPASSILQSAAAFGPILAALANWQLASSSWRLLFLVGIAPAAVCFAIRRWAPEPSAAGPRERPDSGAILRELFTVQPWRRNIRIAILLGVVGITGAGILPFWIPNLVREASVGMAEAAIRERTSLITIWMHFGTLLGVLAFPLLATDGGRRGAFAAFFSFAFLATAATGFFGHDYRLLFLLAPMSTFFAIGLSAGFVLYFPELFPSRLRATGCGIAYNSGRIFAAPMPWIMGCVIGALGGNVAFACLLMSFIFLIGEAAIARAPETQNRELPA